VEKQLKPPVCVGSRKREPKDVWEAKTDKMAEKTGKKASGEILTKANLHKPVWAMNDRIT